MDPLVDGLIEVEIMADSYVRVPKNLYSLGHHRLTTIRARFPRIVLAEVNTHRLLSRNSASSRAIPAKKMRERVMTAPFVPDRFPKEHKGMQASEWVEQDDREYEHLVHAWLSARDESVRISERLSSLGISKQLSNRFVEPVMMHEIIVTATEWENFLFLRADAPAQNEIRILAMLILKAMNRSIPCELSPGEWHLPYGDQIEDQRLVDTFGDAANTTEALDDFRRKITVARCARVSYLNFQGKDDYQSDLDLYNQLLSSGHWSPFEHVARAMSEKEYSQYSHTTPDSVEYGWCGNFRGFIQLRKLFSREVENRKDDRLMHLFLT